MRKRQSLLLWGIYAILVALIGVVGWAFWFRTPEKLTLNNIEGARNQNALLLRDIRLMKGPEIPRPVTSPPPLLFQVLYALTGQEENRTPQYPALEVITEMSVKSREEVFIQAGPILPIEEYTAMATTPGGQKFPLEVGIENPRKPGAGNGFTQNSPQRSNIFYILLPDKIPGTFPYLDITLSGRGKATAWRVHGLPKLAHQVSSPQKESTIVNGEGVQVEAAAWFRPEGREYRVWTYQGNVISTQAASEQNLFTRNSPPAKGAILHTVRLEQDAIQIAYVLNYTRPSVPSASTTTKEGLRLPGISILDDFKLETKQIELEWGSQAIMPMGIDRRCELAPTGTDSTAPTQVTTTFHSPIMAQAFGGEQKWVRITAQLDQMQNSIVPVVFKNIPVMQTPQGPRLDVGDGLKITTAEGLTVALSDPNKTDKKIKSGGLLPSGVRLSKTSPQMIFTPPTGPNSEIPIRIDWVLPGAKPGDFDTQFFAFPETSRQDAAGKWQSFQGVLSSYMSGDTQGYYFCTVPKSGKQIPALGIIVRLGRKLKSTPLNFTIPIHTGLPPNLPSYLK